MNNADISVLSPTIEGQSSILSKFGLAGMERIATSGNARVINLNRILETGLVKLEKVRWDFSNSASGSGLVYARFDTDNHAICDEPLTAPSVTVSFLIK